MSQCPDVLQLLVLRPEILLAPDDVVLLVSYDLLVLELEQLLLFLEVVDDLLQGLFKQDDLLF